MADSDSRIAWHRAQLKKNREALKALEVARFRSQHDGLITRLDSVKHLPSMVLGLNYLPKLRGRLLYNLDGRTIHRELPDVLLIIREAARKIIS
jgi:hypothetical protein